MIRGRLAIAALSAACATSALAVVPPAGVDRTRAQSQVAQPQPDPAVDPRAVVVQPPPEPPPQPPLPAGDPASPAPEPTNSVIVGEPGAQTGRPPVAATIPANTVVADRDDRNPPQDVDQDEMDVAANNVEAVAENAATAEDEGDANVAGDTGDSIPFWPILVVLGVVLIGGGIWALRRPPPVVDPVYDEPAASPPVYVADEPVPPQPLVPFSVRPTLDRAYGAGPPPNLDWAGPRTRIRSSLEPGAISWAE